LESDNSVCLYKSNYFKHIRKPQIYINHEKTHPYYILFKANKKSITLKKP